MYEFYKNSLSSNQLSKFLWLIAVLGSPLIRVNTNLYKMASCSGLISAKVVSTFPVNASNCCLFPLNGGTNFKASSTLINSPFILAILLPTAFWVLEGFIGKNKLSKDLPRLIWYMSRFQWAGSLTSLVFEGFPLMATLLPSGSSIRLLLALDAQVAALLQSSLEADVYDYFQVLMVCLNPPNGII